MMKSGNIKLDYVNNITIKILMITVIKVENNVGYGNKKKSTRQSTTIIARVSNVLVVCR